MLEAARQAPAPRALVGTRASTVLTGPQYRQRAWWQQLHTRVEVHRQDALQPAQACSVMGRPAEGVAACAGAAGCCPARSGPAPRAGGLAAELHQRAAVRGGAGARRHPRRPGPLPEGRPRARALAPLTR